MQTQTGEFTYKVKRLEDEDGCPVNWFDVGTYAKLVHWVGNGLGVFTGVRNGVLQTMTCGIREFEVCDVDVEVRGVKENV